MSIANNDLNIARFSAWVLGQRRQAFERYRSRMHKGLCHQQVDDLTRHALIGTVDELFRESLEKIYELPLDSRGVQVERGWSALTLRVLAPYQGFCETLLDEALRFNRSSCAMSNFTQEHNPSVDYQMAIRHDLAAAWREFALTTNDVLIGATADCAA